MLSYNFSLALASLKERPGLTFLIILTIAIGLGLYTTVQTMAFHSGGVPFPHKSKNVFLIQMDNRETSAEEITEQRRMVDTTYKDVMNLLQMDSFATAHSFNWNSYGVINVEGNNESAVNSEILVTNHSFFTMFETPFIYGSGWDAQADRSGEPAVVISRAMNDRLFGGENSVGQTVRINTTLVKVVGVMADWTITRRFYDRSFAPGYLHEFFVSYQFAINQDLPRAARFDCWATEQESGVNFRTEGLEQLLGSECAWISLWAEIPDGLAPQYHEDLVRYVQSQKELGRFPREIDTYVTDLDEQIGFHAENNGYINMLKMISRLFFAVCLLNAIGIMLAKFIRRSKEVSLRRALGARKKIIIQQYLIEVMLIGLLGGLLGVVISYFGLWGMMKIRLYAVDYTITAESILHQYQLNWLLIGEAFITSVVCAVLVSLYPIWRLCNVAPAAQLKSS